MITFFGKPIPSISHILPFALFIVLTALSGVLPMGEVWMYPVKTVLVGFLLIKFWPSYPEIMSTPSNSKPIRSGFLAGMVGVGVFVIWIMPEQLGLNYPLLGKPTEFNPYHHLSKGQAVIWIGFRLLGTAIVVPVMEEIFWRSFVIRFLIDEQFSKVPIGRFSWFSFAITTVLFGIEHQRWLVGMLAGIGYNLLLYRTRSIFACILAHAITNALLGIYVLVSLQWAYW